MSSERTARLLADMVAAVAGIAQAPPVIGRIRRVPSPSEPAPMPRPVLPWRGADLSARGVPNGKAMGALLSDLERAWMAADFPIDPARLGAMLDAAIASHRAGTAD